MAFLKHTISDLRGRLAENFPDEHEKSGQEHQGSDKPQTARDGITHANTAGVHAAGLYQDGQDNVSTDRRKQVHYAGYHQQQPVG